MSQVPSGLTVVVTVLPSVSVMMMVEPASPVPSMPSPLFSVTIGKFGNLGTSTSLLFLESVLSILAATAPPTTAPPPNQGNNIPGVKSSYKSGSTSSIKLY